MSTKVSLVKVMVFPVVRYGCESWTIKKAECQRIDAFELWCWRTLLDCQEIKLVHPKGNQWSTNTLAWCTEPTHWKRPWWWERLKAGGEGGKRGRDGWMASPTRWTWVGACSEMVKVREVWCAASMGHNESDTTEWLSNMQTRDSLMSMAKTLYSQHRGSGSVRELYLTCHN